MKSLDYSDQDCRSPCVRNCCLDDNDICLGCGRSLTEIRDWHDASNAEKLTILRNSRLRLSQRKFSTGE
ncbi:DUF1289 domain-containing protein [Shewanella avicenniae]|uniref:DUF1289 domain-containing protein n=1 Tax=Shewanella avicenniae TaxID=2814294 RepID=UPI001E504241|nr:DUF1289 domain-containing protein [Shewanella avicenniae]